jgi:CRP-like cAMP-binding protein
MATVRCLENTHLMVLTKEAFDEAIGKMERRSLNDKINFLRNIPVFSLLTRNSLAKITCSLQKVQIVKDSILYREGTPASSVYIVIQGELDVTKTLQYKAAIGEKVENIFKDPLKSSKKQNNLFTKNKTMRQKKMNLFILGKG